MYHLTNIMEITLYVTLTLDIKSPYFKVTFAPNLAKKLSPLFYYLILLFQLSVDWSRFINRNRINRISDRERQVCRMYLKFSAHAYFRTRNSNLKSVSNKNQLEISRNLIRDNRILTQRKKFGNKISRLAQNKNFAGIKFRGWSSFCVSRELNFADDPKNREISEI